MTGFHIAVVPVGKIDAEELEAAMVRASRALRQPMELRGSLPVPSATEDSERGQHRAMSLMTTLLGGIPRLGPGKMIGSDDPAAKPPPKPEAFIFVTDVDLYTAKTDGVFAALISSKKVAVVSVRRMREAFFRRKADHVKQRARLVKEMLRMAGRLQGLKECASPDCVLAPSKVVPDVDSKGELYCRNCSQALFEGKIQI
jgi:predicted Zn-dependent protease